MRSIRSTTRLSSALAENLVYLRRFNHYASARSSVEMVNEDEGYLEMFLIPNRKVEMQLRVEHMIGQLEEVKRSHWNFIDRISALSPVCDDASLDKELVDDFPATPILLSPSVSMAPRKKTENHLSFRTLNNLEPLKTPDFLHRAPPNIQRRLKNLKNTWFRQQFADIFRSGTEAEAKQLLDKFLHNEQLANADLFLEELVRHKLKRLDYGNAFASWSNYAGMERTIAGVDQLLEYILKNDKEAASIQQARIKLICDQVQKIFTPSVAFAECVSAYLVTSKYDEAKILAKLYVISPRSFIDPVKRLGEKGDVQSIERFARLFNDIYYDEIRARAAGKRKRDLPAPDDLEANKSEDEAELKANSNILFLLQAAKRRKKFKYMTKKPKVRKYEVDHRQLDILVGTFLESWIDVADTRNNVKTLDNMHFFIESNKIFIRRGHLEFIENILQRNSITENSFAKFVQA